MPRVVLAARAQQDVERLHRFLRSRDESAARRGVLAMKDAFRALEKAPFMGRPVQDKPELRELVIEFGSAGYLALYRYETAAQVVIVLAIKHQRENDYR